MKETSVEWDEEFQGMNKMRRKSEEDFPFSESFSDKTEIIVG